MTLPDDVARCAGRFEVGKRHPHHYYFEPACLNCLRRTSPGGEYTPHMPPPEFVDGVCPERIAPHD